MEQDTASTRSEVLSLLDEALTRRLIMLLPGTTGHYRFTHALLQETLYSDLSTADRIQFHRQLEKAGEPRQGAKEPTRKPLTSEKETRNPEPPQDVCDHVLRTVHEMGRQGLVKQAPTSSALSSEVAVASHVRAGCQSPVSSKGLLFRQEGSSWTLSYHGISVQMKNAKGFHYIAFLLGHPAQEFHVLELINVTDKQPRLSLSETYSKMSEAQLAEQGLYAKRTLEAHAWSDGQARTQYRRRLAELTNKLAEASSVNDRGCAAAIEAEIRFLQSELPAGSGPRRRTHDCHEAVEKARKAITNRIRAALAQIQQAHPPLWQHLFAAIKTGTFCSYAPSLQTTLPGTRVRSANPQALSL